MRSYRNALGRGLFSILELAVILGVIGVVAAIVGPRMTRAAASSPRVAEQVLVGHLAALRGAIDAYANAHHGHPPDGDPARIVRQLTEFTDGSGNLSPARTARHWKGPYLREIPTLPVGAKKGADKIALAGAPAQPADAAWLYDPATGKIRAATPPDETDTIGLPYCQY